MGPFPLDSAMKEFNKKFKDKSGLAWDDRNEEAKKGKYTFIEKNYESDDEEAGEEVKKEERCVVRSRIRSNLYGFFLNIIPAVVMVT